MKSVLAVILALSVLPGILAAQEALSPCALALSPDGRTLYVAEGSARQIAWFDTNDRKVVKVCSLPADPTGIALSADGARLWVTAGGPEGFVYAVDAASGKVGEKIRVGHTPMAPVLAPDGNRLFVCNRFNHDVSVIDLAAAKETGRFAAIREPVAADVTPDGKWLYVANLLPAGRADADVVAVRITVIDTVSGQAIKQIELPNGSEGLRGLKVSPDGQYVFAAHMVARFTLPTTQLERGWISTDALTIVRAENQETVATVLLDDVDLGFPNPWAVGVSPDSRLLAVSSAGSHELSLIDVPALMAKIEQHQANREKQEGAYIETHNNLSFLIGVRQRVQLALKGPRSLAMDGTNIYVGGYFSDSVDVVDPSDRQYVRVTAAPLGPSLPMSLERRGEMLFNDADLCFQKWLTCVTCHPDARVDGLNWDLLNDGMGNPKNVRTMLLSHRTPPVMTLAVRKDAEAAVRSGMRYIQFAVRPEEDAVAIDAYLKSLQAVPSPWLQNGELSSAAREGKIVFEKYGCIDCHPPPLYTSQAQHDLGTTKGMDDGRPVDTPSLVEIWRTAPYMHDGRAETVKEVLTVHNPGDRRGKTSQMTPQQIDQLVEFVLSL